MPNPEIDLEVVERTLERVHRLLEDLNELMFSAYVEAGFYVEINCAGPPDVPNRCSAKIILPV